MHKYITYIHFIMFLEGQLYENVLKRDSVHKPQYIGNLLCAPIYKSLAKFTLKIIQLITQQMNVSYKLDNF